MLTFEGVDKTYRGLVRRTRALHDFSMQVRPGETVGLIGANGAGKTTLIQLALGYLFPTSGTISVLGSPPGAVSVRQRLGWVPDEPIFAIGTTARGLLDEWLAGHRVHHGDRRSRVNELLERFGLVAAADRRLSTFSLGMQQKAMLAQALSHEPDLLLLDEPFSALDHRAVLLVRREIEAFRARGGAVVISSHHLSELELVCNRALFLADGKIKREERIDDGNTGASIHIQVSNPEALSPLLQARCPAELTDWSINNRSLSGRMAAPECVPDLIVFLCANHVRVESVSQEARRLEDAFLALEEEP